LNIFLKRAPLLATTCLLASCATTTIQSTGSPLQHPLCDAEGPDTSITVLWSPKWRPDQKEPPLRETAALRGIEQYFKAQACIKTLVIRRVALPAQHERLTDAQILAMAHEAGDAPNRVILLVVRELGPRLLLGLPSLIEGGTEVVLEVRVTAQDSTTSLANFRTHWQKGGPFYIKGVKTLGADMETTLGVAFSNPQKTQ